MRKNRQCILNGNVSFNFEEEQKGQRTLSASRSYYAIFSSSNLSGKLIRERDRERMRGGNKKRGTRRDRKKEKKDQKQEITGRRVSGPPPRKNGIFISILSDTAKNEASTKPGKLEKNQATSRSLSIGGSFCAQANRREGNDASSLAKQMSTKRLK